MATLVGARRCPVLRSHTLSDIVADVDAPAGALLRQARHGARLSQAELAARAASTQAMVARYESGDVSPSVATLDRLLRACGKRLRLVAEPGRRLPLSGPVGRKALQHRRDILRLARDAGARRVRVFGSVARGTDTARSDLDLVVDFPVREQGLLPLAHLAEEIAALIGSPVDVAAEDALAADVAARAQREAVAL